MFERIFMAIALASSTSLAAPLGVYRCTVVNGTQGATLVYAPHSQSIVWMPEEQLNTTKANSKGKILNSGEIQFVLFGFQDQADILTLPVEASALPEKMNIQTYHDNDDLAESTQDFLCTRI